MAKRKLRTRARTNGSRTYRRRIRSKLSDTIKSRDSQIPHGTWTDFTSKYGFDDGGSVTDLDLRARNWIVAMLNVELKGRGITAVGYDRPGLHNPCVILILPNSDNASPRKLRSRFLKEPDFHEVALPNSIAERVGEIIAQAYKQVVRT